MSDEFAIKRTDGPPEDRVDTDAWDAHSDLPPFEAVTGESDTDDLPEFDDMATSCGTSGCEKPAIVELKDADDVTGEDPNRCVDCLEHYLRETHWGKRDW